MNAQKAGKFKSEITPIEIVDKKAGKTTKIDSDDIKTNVTLEKLSTLKPAFSPPLSVTPGNSSTMNDGASALILMSEERAKAKGLNILAYIRGYADGATDPDHFPIAPTIAVPKALKNAGVKPSEDFFEVNEAFAVVALANAKRMNINEDKLNVYGSGLSLGHALGSSGSRIICTLISVLHQENGKIGVAGICNGGGGASAIVIEKGPKWLGNSSKI